MSVKFQGQKALSYWDRFRLQCKHTSRTMPACPQATHLLSAAIEFLNLLRRLQRHGHGQRPDWNWQDLDKARGHVNKVRLITAIAAGQCSSRNAREKSSAAVLWLLKF